MLYDPISHLLIVRRDLDKDGLDAYVRILCRQVRKEVELLFDLIDCFALISDDLESR